MAWRHHDSDVNDPVPKDGFSASDVQMLTEQGIDLRPVHSRLLFQGGLATTWDFPGYRSVFKDTEGNDRTAYHTSLPSKQNIPKKTDHQKRVEVKDPKIVATRERKARAAAKKREKRRQGGNCGEGSHPATKRRKTIARNDGPDASEATSSRNLLGLLIPLIPPMAMTNVNIEVVQPSQTHRSAHHSPIATQSASPARSIQQAYGPLDPPATQEESNALNNDTALEKAWFSLARRDLAQTGILESAERAQEKETLVTQLYRTEMENFDCICKLLPTVVERLFQSHEYKQSLFEPFNLAIQAGWGKGLTEEHSKEDLIELMSRMENFDAYADTKMYVEYDKLFKKRYPYVEKISRGFRHAISDLLNVYLDSPPSGQDPPSKPSSGKVPSTSAPDKL
uniref:Uncharacterized protein n=1 Tax=Tanacetum cinerariifolium TaxID=118510 RepID=A0A6L2K1R7_TANCI|nr:hypothetical protein [Tanacetum cinerariifolium]